VVSAEIRSRGRVFTSHEHIVRLIARADAPPGDVTVPNDLATKDPRVQYSTDRDQRSVGCRLSTRPFLALLDEVNYQQLSASAIEFF